MTAPDLPENMAEIVANAHDQLHKEQVEKAHELLHLALGVDNESDAAEDLGLFVDKRSFDHAFRTACRKNKMRAAYVLLEKTDTAGKQVRIITGGDAGVCQVVDHVLRRGPGVEMK